MSREKRENTVAVLAKRLRETQGVIVVDYTGLSVERAVGLRRQIKEAGSELKVAKNTLLRIATKDTTYEQLHDFFAGQTAVALIDREPALLAKILAKFLKDNLKDNPNFAFKIKAGVLDNNLLNQKDIELLGNLPSKEVLLGQFVGLLACPLVGFVSTLADIPRKFLRVLTAISEQKNAAQ